MSKQRFRQSAVLGLALFGTLTVVYACTRDDAPTQVRSTSPHARPSASVSAADRARVTGALQRVAWVGQMHAEAMRDLRSNKAAWLGNEADKHARLCNAVRRLTAKYAARAEQLSGVRFANRDQIVDQAVNATRQCRQPSQMSIYGNAALGRMFASLVQDDTPTGDFLSYVDAVTSAVSATSGAPSEVYPAAEGVLASASGLSAADYNVVASAVSLAESSSDDWYATASSSGGGGLPDDTIFAMSVFKPMTFPWRALGIVVGSDVIGCGAGAASTWWAAAGGPVGWSAIGGQCAIWGIAGSAGAALSMI